MENSRINELIEKAKKDDKIIAVALFGSALKGKGRDVDICLFLDKKYSNLEMSKKRLGYLKDFGEFDINVFQQMPVYIRIRIVREGKILFVKDEDRLYEIAFDNLKEFEFYEKVYRMCLESVKNG